MLIEPNTDKSKPVIDVHRPTGPRLTLTEKKSLGELVAHSAKDMADTGTKFIITTAKQHKFATTIASSTVIAAATHFIASFLMMSDTRVSVRPYMVGPASTTFVSSDVGGVSNPPCTGDGSRSTSGGNTIITFLASGSLICSVSFSGQVLVVAGGAGGLSGAGGAGGYCATGGSPTCGLGSAFTIPSGTTTVTVGAGGIGGQQGLTAGFNGNNSVFSTITAIGGSPGGEINQNCASGAGGSGGSAGANGSGGTLTGCAGTSGQGNNGGGTTDFGSPYPSGGGGGAGAVGSINPDNNNGGAGGVGVSNSISGSAVFYAGGGGGSIFSSGGTSGGLGGNGGGGQGGGPGHGNGFDATVNTGGGGGGASFTATGGTGGSGIVIISCVTGLC